MPPAIPAPAVPPRPSLPAPARLLDQVSAFTYVTVANAPSYRAILEVFVEAKEHYVIELRPAEVRDRLARSGLHHDLPGADDLDRHLDQLADWGNLQRSHDTSAVSRVEDFYRRRFIYRLTAAGEAAHRAVREVEATVGRSGSLQTAMLREIRDALAALAAAARAGDGPGVVRALHLLRAAFDSLTKEANLFLLELDRQTSGERIDEDRFFAHKQALLAYLGKFLEELRRIRPEVAARVLEVEALDPERFLAAAAPAAERPPVAEGEDPLARWIADERERWAGVRGWFTAHGAAPPRVERLHGVAVEAVVRLTRALARLNERRARAADRAADFRTLARWFSECASDADAHALWASAFGLYAPRHFHLLEDDPDLTRPGESWWDARPVEVPVRLRTHGAVSRLGRAPPALDFADGRTWMAARRRRERAQLAEAMARFAGRGAVRLSDVAELSPAELDELLALLDEALTAPRAPDGTRRARTADGRLDVVLRPPAADRAWVTLATPSGRLRCLDYELQVSGAVPARAAAEGSGP
jgi:uncharacterized protein (TIGR02677 family)